MYNVTLIQSYRNPAIRQQQAQSQPDKLKQSKLLTKEAIALLKLSSWQVRALLVPGCFPQVLTDWQELVFLQKVSPKSTSTTTPRPDPANLKPVAIQNVSRYPNTIKAKHKSLHKLLGVVKQLPHTPKAAKTLGITTSFASSHPALSPRSLSPTKAVLPISRPKSARPKSAEVVAISPAKAPLPQSESALPSEDSSQEVALQGRKVNRFAGKSCSSSKQAGSPLTGGQAKVSKLRALRVVTRNKLIEKLRGLKSEIGLEISSCEGTLQNALTITRKEIQQFNTKLTTHMSEECKQVRTETTMLISSYKEDWQNEVLPSVQSTSKDITALQQSIQQLQESQGRIETQLTD